MNEEKTIEAPEVEEQKTTDLKTLVEKNIKWSQVIYEQNKKLKHRLDFIIWGGVLKWLIILIPIIFGIIYLPALLKPVMEQYSGLLGTTSGVGVQSKQLESLFNSISPSQIQEVMKLLQK